MDKSLTLGEGLPNPYVGAVPTVTQTEAVKVD